MMALYRVNLTLDFSLKMTLKCVIIFNLDISTVILINLDNMMLLNNCTQINCHQMKNTKYKMTIPTFILEFLIIFIPTL